MRESTYLKKNQLPTSFIPRMFHPNLDDVVHSLSIIVSPLSQGYESIRMSSKETLSFQGQLALNLSKVSHNHIDIQSTSTLFSLACTTQRQ
jgi:hypothetical protein